MEISQIKQLSIVDYLESVGHIPTQVKGNNYWYCSPLREEYTPSFKVNAVRNLWYDFGTGEYGDVIDLVCAMKQCSFAEALLQIEKRQPHPSFSFGGKNYIKVKENGKDSSMQLCAVDPLTHPALLAYLKGREIPKDIAQKYCKEVHYSVACRNYFAIGFGNDAGGWELRSSHFKGCYASKAISTFSFGGSNLKLFEGFMDFLSDVVMNGEPKSNIIVLNSLALLPRITDKLSAYSKIECYLDNDTAGRKAFENLRAIFPQAVDCSMSYSSHKDLNEQLVSKLKIENKTIFPKPKKRGMKI